MIPWNTVGQKEEPKPQSLDERLEDVLDNESIPELIGDRTNGLVEAIKQAFIDDGWEMVADNERYRLFYGELPKKYGKVDVMEAYKTYKEKESFHQNFGRYLEAAKAKGEELMTGAEWLARFNKEKVRRLGVIEGNNMQVTHQLQDIKTWTEIARRASGVDE